jgi:hypothetical protein
LTYLRIRITHSGNSRRIPASEEPEHPIAKPLQAICDAVVARARERVAQGNTLPSRRITYEECQLEIGYT